MLEPLGVASTAEELYRRLLKQGPATTERLAALAGVDAADAERALDDLRRLGLATPDPDRADCWHAESPEVTLASLMVAQQEQLLERQRELDKAQAAVSELMRLGRARPSNGTGPVEVCADPDAVARRRGHLARTAERCVQRLDRSAGAVDGGDELALLGRGVEVQSVHERPSLLAAGRFDALRRLVAAGQQVRTLPCLATDVALYDGTAAVVVVDRPDGQPPTALFVKPSELLTGLVLLFELLWERAVPLVPAQSDDDADVRPPEVDELLVALLAAGFKDESIARQLSISPSTVTRRMARLMELTGTSTRFQLGMQAVRRGWI
jgi:predicted transcriptional regulator